MAAMDVGFKSIVVAINGVPKCNCEPTDLTQINSKLDTLITIGTTPILIPPVTQPSNEEHVVIVADHNSPYWQRLVEAIANAKKTYHGLQDTTLPAFSIGVHPQAVVYRNNVPVRIVKGQYDVEALLSRLSRGEPI